MGEIKEEKVIQTSFGYQNTISQKDNGRVTRLEDLYD
jgi:hypothetical protein